MASDGPAGRLREAASSVVLTRRGWGFLAAAVVSFVLAPVLSLPAMLYLTGLLLGLVLLSTGFVFLGHSRVRIERSFTPQVVQPGALSRATVRVTNLSVLPCLEARWEDRLPHGISGDSVGVLPALGGSHSAESRVGFSYALQGLRRGRHPIGPLRVDVADPFGLVYRRHAYGSSEPLTVLPRVVNLPAIAPRGASDDGATRPAPRNVGLGDDDVIARTYLPGDALKRIHWKATAHREQLMVRQEEQQVTPRAAVHLDCEPTSQGTARDRKGEWEHSASFEWCVVAAASITTHLVRAGYVAALQSSGHAVDRVVAEGQDTLEDALVDLAVLEPEARDHDARVAAERAVFAVLGRLSADRARHWVRALGASRLILAFVAHGTSAEALEVLDAARWKVVEYGPQDDLVDLWSQFDGARADAAR
ncbi:DUF58 domain-containing protein [Aeromicrobium chenweiae]|uniref:DUF58 domain-containing protein n=1 Tax=Aeromicrobium chenweiae TaxID=2079793 RepID=A0A2S0WKM3_9ACTN|nr:DUF58 domain-containing protein [Aeromicrobium chenweiae]AWB91790.1 hypothetical protein C3E78_05980 [Aeromicrobium chenweiae]TGN32634.1 DUF58 domain-containing protein [Aeromicrobium chenweiae]